MRFRPLLVLLLLISVAASADDLAGRRLLFVSGEADGAATLMILDLAQPLLPRPLASMRDEDGAPLTASQATLSPEADAVAFRYGTPGGSGRIHLLDPFVPGELRPFGDPDSEADEGMPDWSPDGSMLALISDRGGTVDLYVVDALEGELSRRLTNDAARESDPAWHPDAVGLAYVGDADGDEEIYLTDALGGAPRQLTHNTWADLDPVWHPDGRRLALVTTVPGEKLVPASPSAPDSGGAKSAFGPESPYVDIETAPATVVVENRDIVLLDTVDGSLEFVVGSPGSDIQPAFSADGRYLAFASDRSGDYELYVYDLETGFLKQVTFNSAADDLNPLWLEER